MDVVWDGVTQPEAFLEEGLKTRHAAADAAKGADWPRLFELLAEHRDLVNCCRLGGTSLYTPLHQAAHLGASVDVVQRLIAAGAWRTLRNARGERPIDVAERNGHTFLRDALTPVRKWHVPQHELSEIQSNFHAVIMGRAEKLVREQALRLPELEPLLEIDPPRMWFAVPGMYGGFNYRLESTGPAATSDASTSDAATLVSESWCRVFGGSGQRHEITAAGSQLVAEGFV